MDGPYALEVSDLYEGGGPRHVFRVRWLPTTQPDFDASLAADRFAGAAGKAIDIAVSVTRRGGLKDDLAFRAEGLPESARVESVAGKDPKKATVRVLGIDAAWSGAFRLYAYLKGHESDERLVVATVPEVSAAIPHLWLSVTK